MRVNKLRKIISLCIYVSSLLTLQSVASECAAPGKYVLPFKMYNNLIIIDVSINNSHPLSFILDSGVSDIIITELGLGDSLELNYASEIKVAGLGKGEAIDAFYSVENDVEIAGIISSGQKIRVLMQDVFSLSKRMGQEIHGLIGYSVFKNYIVEIRYAQRKIILYEPESFSIQKNRKAFTLPLEINQTKPYISAAANINGDSTINVKLFIDTGASHTIWLAEDCEHYICVPKDAVPKYLGAGLNGDITGHMSVIKKLYLGNVTFKTMITSFPDHESVQNLFQENNRNGSIGAEILRRFTIIFNYPNNEITFIPNSSLKDALAVNRAGFEIEMPIPGFPIYTVAYIENKSPSADAGLQQGDQIVTINGNNTLHLSFNEIIGYFYQKAGKKLFLTVRRGATNHKIKFRLKEPFTFPPLEVSSSKNK